MEEMTLNKDIWLITEVKPLNADDSVKAKIGSRQTEVKPWRV